MKKSVLKIFQVFKKILGLLFFAFFSQWKRKLFFGFGLTVFLLFLWLLVGTLTGGWLYKISLNQYQSLEERADFVYSYEQKDLIKFNDLFPSQKYSVLMDKVVVNLKTEHPRFRNPMGVFQFYLRVDSRKTAIKIKALQKVILDRIQREIEDFTYDETVTLEGKRDLKSTIQDSVNDILTRGRVEEVYFKQFVTKP